MNRLLGKDKLDTAPLTIGGDRAAVGKSTEQTRRSKKTVNATTKNSSGNHSKSNNLQTTSNGFKGLGVNALGSYSNSNLSALVSQLSAGPTGGGMVQMPSPSKASSVKTIGHISQITSTQSLAENEVDDHALQPDKHLHQLIYGKQEQQQQQQQQQSQITTPSMMFFDHDALDGFYLPVKDEFVQAWTNKITQAVRQHELQTLRDMHANGERLQACNRFGESIVHLCIRRGNPEILRFLIHDAGVSVRVCDDYGRSPMHDACWSLSGGKGTGTNSNAYQMMALLLTECPMQLLIKDKRGSTPLAYVPRKQWAECNAFLDRQHRKGRLLQLPKTVIGGQ